MKKFVLLAFLAVSTIAAAQTETEDKAAIRTVLDNQVKAWNSYDLEGFMQGYWKSDSLKFFGGSGVTSGWQQTLERYKKGYPDKAHTGELRFELEEISRIEANSYYVMGRFFLSRDAGDARGIFMLVLKKINGDWKIVADTSCSG